MSLESYLRVRETCISAWLQSPHLGEDGANPAQSGLPPTCWRIYLGKESTLQLGGKYHLVDWIMTLPFTHGSIQKTKKNRLTSHVWQVKMSQAPQKFWNVLSLFKYFQLFLEFSLWIGVRALVPFQTQMFSVPPLIWKYQDICFQI